MKIDFAHLVTKILVDMIMFCVFMFVFTERGGGVVRTRPKKRLNPDCLKMNSGHMLSFLCVRVLTELVFPIIDRGKDFKGLLGHLSRNHITLF